MSDREPRQPSWWTDKNASAWDRVKVALERDWEQTKNDFSSNAGKKLNQNLADTVKQSAGSESIPPIDVKSRPTPPKEAIKDANKARENAVKEAENAAKAATKGRENATKEQEKLVSKVQDARKDLSKEELAAAKKVTEARKDLAHAQAKAKESLADAQVEADKKIAGAHENAIKGVAKEGEKIAEAAAKRDEAFAKWQDAEEEVRYGYSVRSQYPGATWDDVLETKLRRDWDTLETGRSWDESRALIRRGWDYAGSDL